MDFSDLLNTFGFPVAVAAFALWNAYKHEQFLQDVLTSTLKENTEATQKLSKLVSMLLKQVKGSEVNEDEL